MAYVNTTSGTMKSVAIKMIKSNRPVFFGSDVGQFSDGQMGVMDTDLYDYTLGFNFSLRMTKADRIRMGASAMTHAMVLTGVDLDKDGKSVKWRVENSWGVNRGKGGYFLMTDRWFDEYVYQIVCAFSDAPKELVEVFHRGDAVVLPAWDPMVCIPVTDIVDLTCLGFFGLSRWQLCCTMSFAYHSQESHQEFFIELAAISPL